MKRYLVPVLLSLSAGCGGTEAGPVGVVDPLSSAKGMCAEWASSACTDKVLAACGSTQADCRTRQAAYCEALVQSHKVSSPFSVPTVKKCLISVKKAYEDAVLEYAEYNLVTRLNGPDCGNLSGATASGTGGTASVSLIGGGLLCTGKPAKSCVSGFYCDSSHCVQRLAAGQACCETTGTVTCASEALCSEDSACVGSAGNQVCKVRGTVTDCTRDDECREGQFCDAGRCAGMLPLSTYVPLCESLGGLIRQSGTGGTPGAGGSGGATPSTGGTSAGGTSSGGGGAGGTTAGGVSGSVPSGGVPASGGVSSSGGGTSSLDPVGGSGGSAAAEETGGSS